MGISYCKWLIIILLISNLLTVGFFVWREHFWRLETFSFASYAGALQAGEDFSNKKYRLYRLVPDGKMAFSGKTEKGFEIWDRPYFEILGHPHTYAENCFVDIYNKKMRIQMSKINHETQTP